MRVREDTIRRRDGSTGIYSVVERPDFVVIVAVDDDGRVHLVEQYRYPVKGRYWELKAPGNRHREPSRGKWRGGELREETGLEAARMFYAGHLFEACGYSNNTHAPAP